jgi:cell wall-associated NlpC family hydrolase
MLQKNNIKLLIIVVVSVVTLTSCSSVRLAVYDYQKRHALAHETSSRESVPETKKAISEREAITEKASKYIGSKYAYGSCDPGRGFDCSGLVYHVAKSQDISLPRSSSSMATIGKHIDWKKAEPGDLIFFGDKQRINHVGIVEKNKGNQIWIIHSSSSNGVLREDILVSEYWKKRVLFAIDITTLKSDKT